MHQGNIWMLQCTDAVTQKIRTLQIKKKIKEAIAHSCISTSSRVEKYFICLAPFYSVGDVNQALMKAQLAYHLVCLNVQLEQLMILFWDSK